MAKKAAKKSAKKSAMKSSKSKAKPKKAAKKKLSASDVKEKRKIFQTLMGRGFPPGLILNKLGRIKKEDIDGEDWE